jgi:predicted membrane protein
MDETNPPTNQLAIISLLSALLTIFSFCIGWAPFLPLTSLVCYPAAIFFGAVALISGIAALGRIRSSGESGRGMALTGASLGGLTILATICAVALTISAIAAIVNQFWTQTPTP